MTLLTDANVREYVQGYHDANAIESGEPPAVIRFTRRVVEQGNPVMHVKVDIGADHVDWVVWEEHDEGRPFLMGEF